MRRAAKRIEGPVEWAKWTYPPEEFTGFVHAQAHNSPHGSIIPDEWHNEDGIVLRRRHHYGTALYRLHDRYRRSRAPTGWLTHEEIVSFWVSFMLTGEWI